MSNTRTPTTEKLAAALRDAGASQSMIDKALSGYFDDFKSDIALPINQLVADAKSEKLHDIAKRAMDGEFDAEEWEADEWAASEDGQSTFREIGGMPR